MKKYTYLILFALTLFLCDSFNEIFAQGASCADATQLCDDPACGSYEIGSGGANDTNASGNSSCLGSAPNATWFFLIDDQGGGGTIDISNNPACDTDFAAWGPFDTPADALAACSGGISATNEVGCDFSSDPGGEITMPATSQVGDVYLMVITNFDNDPGISVTVTAPPLECCPVATGSKADIDVCSGSGVPPAALADFEGTTNEVSGAAQFITDLGLSTSATALVAPTAAEFVNTTCAPVDVVLYYLYECDADCNGVGDGPTVVGSFTATVYPDASTFVVTETPGACGTAAMVSIATSDGTVCFTDAGTVPPAGTCPSTSGMAPLSYSYDPGFVTACNATFSGTVVANCAPTGCIDCPDIAPAITAQELCSGTDVDFATVETEVNVTGNNQGAFTYFTDAAFTTAYAGPLTNTTCDPIVLTIFGRLQCSDAGAAGTADEFDDFSFMVTVYPAQPTASVTTNVMNACSEQTSVVVVDLLGADGTSVCDTKMFDANANATCASVSETIMYDWTIAEIETITTAPAALACYTAVSGMESVTVYPAQPTVNVINVADACTAATTVVTFQVTDAAGNVCDDRTYDATANTTCAVAVQNFTDTYSATDLETLFGSPAISCYTDLALNENVNVYPDASTFVVTETPGGCGTAAMVSIATAGGEVCFTDTGAVPPAGTCPSTPGMAPLTYNFDPGFATACNATFSGTVVADCAPTGCIDCPDIAPAITAQEICSGSDVDFATVEIEVNVTGNNQGAFTYFTDAGFTTAYAGPLTNMTCDPIVLTIFGRLQCVDLNAAGTAEEFDDFSFMVTVYPAQPTASVTTNVMNACSEQTDVVAVDLLGSDGTSVCDTKMFDASANATCTSVSETIMYDWTVAEIETITTTPAALACYAAVSGMENVTVYPAQPTANVINVADACTADATVVTFQVIDGAGNVCDDRTYDAAANMTCSVEVQNFTDTYSATDLETLFGSPAISCYTDLTLNENVNVYPDANNFGLTEILGSCGVASSVEITAENGDVCFTEMGNIPMDPGCDNPDDVQDLTYSFDPGFIAACNTTFGNTLPASCATTAMSPSPSFTCPTGPIDFCALTGPIDLLPMDANNVGATGTFSGTGANYVVGNQDPGMGATLDLSSAPRGTYTLEYTLVSPGCPPVTTGGATGSCTFELVINCDANGGRF